MTAGGERALIARLRARLAALPPFPHVLLPPGDDGAVVRATRGEVDVLTTDTLVEGVHFAAHFCHPADVGRKALHVNLSDLAAMGATPRSALLSLGLPEGLSLEAFDAFLDGFLSVAEANRVALIGGNLTRSPGPWFITVTALGTAKRRAVLTRSGGRPGDLLFVTGQLGAGRSGLWWLEQRKGEEPVGVFAEAVEHYRCGLARVRHGVRVARTRCASACMDLSDGLADAVTQVAEASGTGAEIELSRIPAHPSTTEAWGARGSWEALLGGDDYELLVAVPPRRRRAFEAALGHRLAPVTMIGRLTPQREGLRVKRADATMVPLPRGYEHFAETVSRKDAG
ncbi:MAG: thiamine-phosphate kinase [Vicinamibacterales bacterium]